MTPETYALVEQVYAAGKAERPFKEGWELHRRTESTGDWSSDSANLWEWHELDGDGNWVEHGDERSLDCCPDGDIGWSLVLACWARRLVPTPPLTRRRTIYEVWRLDPGDDNVLVAADPDPIRAMCKALMEDAK